MVSSINRWRVLFRLAVKGVARIYQLLSAVMWTQVLLLSIISCHRDTTVLIMSIEDRLAHIYNILHLDSCIMSDLGWATGSLVKSMVSVLTPWYLSGWVLNPYHFACRSDCCLDIATNWPCCWSFLWSIYGYSAPLIIYRCWWEAALPTRLHTSFSASRVRCSARTDCTSSLWGSIHFLAVGLHIRIVSTWITFMRWLVIFWSSSIDPLGWLLLFRHCLRIWIEKAKRAPCAACIGILADKRRWAGSSTDVNRCCTTRYLIILRYRAHETPKLWVLLSRSSNCISRKGQGCLVSTLVWWRR